MAKIENTSSAAMVPATPGFIPCGGMRTSGCRAFRNTLCWGIALWGFFSGLEVRADEYSRADFHPVLYGDFHSTPGLETAFPFVKFNDLAPKDGYPETVSLSFRIYAAGTDAPVLRQTQVREISMPAVPPECEPRQAYRWSNPEFLLERAFPGSRLGPSATPRRTFMGVEIGFSVFCGSELQRDWYGGSLSIIYSTDLSGVENNGNPGPSWSRAWTSPIRRDSDNLREMVDIAAIDQDLDGIADYVMVSLGNGEYPPSASRQTVFYLGGKTGVINTSIPLSNGGTFTLPQSGKSYVTRPIVPDVDMDGDGVKSDQDCEDSDPTVYPGATEICDGKDNNCNYSVDESLQCPLP